MGVEESEFTTSLLKNKRAAGFPSFYITDCWHSKLGIYQGDTSDLKRKSAKENKSKESNPNDSDS